LALLLTSLVIVATPGDRGAVHRLRRLVPGARASLVAAAGCTLGIVPHLAAAITGTAALLRSESLRTRSRSLLADLAGNPTRRRKPDGPGLAHEGGRGRPVDHGTGEAAEAHTDELRQRYLGL
jgi:hypothetical protein